MREFKVLMVVSVVALLVGLGCAPAEEEEIEGEALETEEVEEPEEVSEPTAQTASATLTTADGAEVGTVTFTETAAGVQVSADFHDVEGDGQHGFHLHQNGECTPPDFTSAGDHFNPETVDHACPPTTPRHAGDFGNLEITGGSGIFDLTTDLVTVAPGATSVVGKAVLLHAMEDDCSTQPSGDAGGRWACGVVELGAGTGTGDGMDEGDEGTAEEGEPVS